MNPFLIKLAVGAVMTVVVSVVGAFFTQRYQESAHGEEPRGRPDDQEPSLNRCCSCDQPIEDRPSDSQQKKYVLPNCGHTYHWACLQRLNQNTGRCAQCRRPIGRASNPTTRTSNPFALNFKLKSKLEALFNSRSPQY